MMRQGTKAAKKTMKALARRSMPSHTMVRGIQDTGGMGRTISKMGRMKRSKPRYQPMSRPMGTPMAMARTKPVSATVRLERMLTPRVAPSGLGLTSLTKKSWTISMGEARKRSDIRPEEAITCQMIKKPRMPATDRVVAVYLSRFFLALHQGDALGFA